MKQQPSKRDIAALSRYDDVLAKWQGQPGTIDNIRAALIDVLHAFVGVGEIGTSNRGHWVDRWQEMIGLEGKAWCMAFVQAMYYYASSIFQIRDMLPYDNALARAVWNWASQKGCTTASIDDVQPGDIIIWSDGNTISGHTGIVTGRSGSTIATVEGNTSSANWRDGGHVEEKYYVLDESWGKPQKCKRWARGVIQFSKLFAAATA
jgi:hypothetical protein